MADGEGQEAAARAAPAAGDSTSRRVAINTVSNWVSMGAQVAANMFLLAYVLRFLDEEQFGIFRLAVSLSIAAAFLSFGMSASVLQLAAERIAARDWERLSDVLSMARTLLLGAAVVGVLAITGIALFGLGTLKVPEASRTSAAVLMVMVGVASGLQVVSVAYDGALRAWQRYDLSNGAGVISVTLNVALVVACFEGGWVNLEVLGAARLLSALFGLVAQAVLVRRLLVGVRLSFGRFKASAARAIFAFGAWTAVKMTSRVVMEQAAAPLVSATVGVAAVAALAVPQLASQYLIQVVSGLTLTLWPIATGYAVRGEREGLARLYRMGTRLSMFLIVPAVAVLVTHGEPLIRALKPELAWTYPLMLVYMGLFVTRACMLAADHLLMASGSVRGLALSQAVATVFGVALGLAVAAWTTWGLYGIVIALFVPLALQSLLYLPWRVRKETGVHLLETYASCVGIPILGGIAPLAAGWLLASYWPPQGIWLTLAQMGVAGAAYVPVAWMAILRREEREVMLRAVRIRRPPLPPETEAAPGKPGARA